MRIEEFQKQILDYYREHGRTSLPWRQPEPDGTLNAYKILVSEIMLQQTQVPRVIAKYNEFLTLFPTQQQLAQATQAEVIKAWLGLGYNRRAQYVWQAAKQLPINKTWTIEQLQDCKGIGYNTAAAVRVYTYNQPHVFIETNIRSVLLHHFFAGQTDIDDTQLIPIIENTLEGQNPRELYWALMDYGTYIKQTTPNPSRASKHHTKQTKFKGSKRQIRGRVLRELATGPVGTEQLAKIVADDRLNAVLQDLAKEGLVETSQDKLQLA